MPRPARACSAYLIQHGGNAIVADFGTGAFSNLRRHLSFEDLDAVFVSHMHADHFIDVVPLRYALKYGERTNDRKVALWLPPEGEAMLRAIVATFPRESRHDFLDEVFDLREYQPAGITQVGALNVRFAPTRHYIPTYALRCEAGGSSVTYSGDTAPCDEVVALARSTELFLCEATLLSSNAEYSPRGHSTAREAAEMASAAAVKRLVLTHYSTASDPATMLAEARGIFRGDVVVADDNATFEAGDT